MNDLGSAGCAAVTKATEVAPPSGLEKFLRVLSVVTMLMTVPQVLTIWVGGNANGVSLLSWGAYLFSACLWFVYGLRKRDKTIYLACIGWILLDAAIVIGAIVNRSSGQNTIKVEVIKSTRNSVASDGEVYPSIGGTNAHTRVHQVDSRQGGH